MTEHGDGPRVVEFQPGTATGTWALDLFNYERWMGERGEAEFATVEFGPRARIAYDRVSAPLAGLDLLLRGVDFS